MSSTGRRRPRASSGLPAALAITLIGLLCAGILAMHHLAGGDHAAGMSMSSPPASSLDAAITAAPDDGASGPMGSSNSGMAVAAPGPEHLTASAGDDRTDHMLGACMSVLLGGLLVLLYSAACRWARRTRDSLIIRVRTGGPRPGRGPPRDLLAQLCVLRT